MTRIFPDRAAFRIAFKFTPGKKLVTAESRFDSFTGGRGKVVNEYIGGFISQNHLKLDYIKKARHVFAPGTAYLKLKPDGVLEGTFSGYASHYERLYLATVILRREQAVRSGTRRKGS